MAILINQKFPRCTLCGKMFPLKVQPIVLGEHQLCSERCVRLLYKLRPDQAPQDVSLEKALTGRAK